MMLRIENYQSSASINTRGGHPRRAMDRSTDSQGFSCSILGVSAPEFHDIATRWSAVSELGEIERP